MKKLIASMIAVAFLMTGSMFAANASTTAKATSTARPAMSQHVGHKQGSKKPAGKQHKNAKAAKSHKPGKQTQSKKPGKKTAGK